MLKHTINAIKYDVTKISNLQVSKKFFNSQKNYILKFNYKTIEETNYLLPIVVCVAGPIGIGLQSTGGYQPKFYDTIKYYYEKEEDALQEKNIIIQKQKFMDNYNKKLEDKLHKQFLKENKITL